MHQVAARCGSATSAAPMIARGGCSVSQRASPRIGVEFGGAQFSSFKSNLVDLAVAKLSPIADEMKRLTDDPAHVDRILIEGAERASAIASKTMDAVKDIVGFIRNRFDREEVQ